METTVGNQKVHHVRTLLRFTYGIIPIAAGADKFIHLLANWEKYLAPSIAELLPFSPHTFMLIVGVVEIIAGIIVFIKPRIGGYIVAGWLLGIVINLLIGGEYLDIAVRDLAMAIGAFVLAKLSEVDAVYNSHEQKVTEKSSATLQH